MFARDSSKSIHLNFVPCVFFFSLLLLLTFFFLYTSLLSRVSFLPSFLQDKFVDTD